MAFCLCQACFQQEVGELDPLWLYSLILEDVECAKNGSSSVRRFCEIEMCSVGEQSDE